MTITFIAHILVNENVIYAFYILFKYIRFYKASRVWHHCGYEHCLNPTVLNFSHFKMYKIRYSAFEWTHEMDISMYI